MKNTLLSILICVLSPLSLAYEGNPDEQVSSFFAELLSGKTDSAISNLYASNIVTSQKTQDLAVLKQQVGTISAIYGSFIGPEKILEEEISASVVRIVMVAKYELHPVIWEFYFYRPKDKWIISQALFVDQFQVVGSHK